MDIRVASELLSKLNLQTQMDNYQVDVKHFRVAEMPAGDNIKMHKHSSYEYHIITSGRCKVNTDSAVFEIGPGEFYLTAPGVLHEQIAISSGGYIEYSLNCEINSLNDCESETSYMVKLLSETECKPFKDTQGITKLFEQALYEAYHKNIGFYGSIKNIVASIIIRSARNVSGNVSSDREAAYMYKDNDFRIIQIERFIQDNISVNLTTDDIASYMCLSNRQICRIINEKTGMSTKELILNLKLQKAKSLLGETTFTVRDISGILGFDSQIYFNQFFKKKEGVTPGDYRRSIKG